MRSDRPLPAGIIGSTFCVSAVWNQTMRRAVDGLRGADGRIHLLGVRARKQGSP